MPEIIEKIRVLLDELQSSKSAEEPSFKESFQLFELPEIVASIVDYLQRFLLPYEAAIYWYLFRYSIVAMGDVFVRISNKMLRSDVISSSRLKQGTKLSETAVREALQGLQRKGAIA